MMETKDAAEIELPEQPEGSGWIAIFAGPGLVKIAHQDPANDDGGRQRLTKDLKLIVPEAGGRTVMTDKIGQRILDYYDQAVGYGGQIPNECAQIKKAKALNAEPTLPAADWPEPVDLPPRTTRRLRRGDPTRPDMRNPSGEPDRTGEK